MAQINCSECGKKISERASFCPHCGCTNQPYTYCKVCGEKTKDGNFCTNCGISMEDTNTITKPRCSIALAGGITGICSLLIDIFGATAIVAIVLSSIGLSKTLNGELKGKGWAITGLACGIFELIFKVIVLINYLG